MSYEPTETQDYVAAYVMNFAHDIIDRADDNIGSKARRDMLDICDRQTALKVALRREFSAPTVTTNTEILVAPAFMGRLCGANLRRLAALADYEHERSVWQFHNLGSGLLSYEAQVKSRINRCEQADNPNAFRNMARYLNITANINDEAAKKGHLVHPVHAAADAKEMIDNIWRKTLGMRSRHKPPLGLPRL